MRWLLVCLALCSCDRSSGRVLYVANEGSGDVSVIDASSGTVTALIPVGESPRDLHVSADGETLIAVVANGVALVDRATQTLSRTIAIADARALDISGELAYVASPNVLSVVDVVRGTIVRRADICAQPTGARLTATTIVVACADTREVLLIDRESLSPTAHLGLAHEPAGLFLNGGEIFALGSMITVIDLAQAVVLRSIGTPASAVVVLADGTLLAANAHRGSATIVSTDGSTHEIAKIGARPSAAIADGNSVFIANGPSNDVTVVDARARHIVARIPVGSSPSSLIAAPAPRGLAPLPHLGRVPTFALTDEAGHPIANRDLGGAPWVANFIFTRCPTACPLYTERMATLHHAIPGLRIVSFSVDPDFDTPERLRDFAARHNALVPVWSFVTGPFADIRAAVVDGFKIAMGRDDAHASEGNVFHGEQAVLVDGGGAIRGYYALSDADAAKKIATDLARLGVVSAAAH